METLEAINKRKSIRAYKDEQITKEELDKIIGVANKAPNAGPFQVSVIQNKEFLSEINDKTKEFMLNSEVLCARELLFQVMNHYMVLQL